MNQITIKAYAKINLGLDVLGKRPNGYHDLKMIMQTVNLYDVLTFKKMQEPGVSLKINFSSLPVNENNLIVKAAKLMMEHYSIKEGVSIELNKNNPIAAGMAGGSADAAATLKAMNQLFELNASQKELMELGVTLGADVPYCIMEGTALSEGIGEILTPLPKIPMCWFVIVKPNVSVSTKFVYQNLVLDETTIHPDIDGIVTAIKNSDLSGITSRLENVLETVTIPKYPRIKEIKHEMLAQGAIGSLMSGSGPTVFGIFQSNASAKQCYNYFKQSVSHVQTYLAIPYQP